MKLWRRKIKMKRGVSKTLCAVLKKKDSLPSLTILIESLM